VARGLSGLRGRAGGSAPLGLRRFERLGPLLRRARQRLRFLRRSTRSRRLLDELTSGGRRVPVWGPLGILSLGAGLWALQADVPGWNALWYVAAWYGYLLVLDSVLFLKRRRSFVSHDRGKFLSLLFWSLPFWMFFEACNLVLRDWYYVFGLRDPLAAALLTAAAFATVLPACLFHAELLEAFGIWRGLESRPLRIPAWAPISVAAAGLLCVALPLLFPRSAFPLIWFAPVGLEARNYRSGAESLLRDLEAGRPGRLLRLLAAGLWAGVVWELFNSLARCKWVYAVPGFEGWKLFEMPLAGYLGFPVFAVGAFCFFSAVEEIVRRPTPRAVAAAAALLFCAAVYPALQRQTVRSLRPLLSELSGLDDTARERLAKAGVQTPERLARAARREGIPGLSARAGVSEEVLRRARDEAVLAIHKGMGVARARLLEAAGIGDLGRLAREDPDPLGRRLGKLAERFQQEPPRPEEVRVWVEAARRSSEGLPRR
jgi:hypothetical protein